ncbi:MAG: Lrp/AsnC ligand binding domain-containing protein [Methanomassiliicoccales archaeon]
MSNPADDIDSVMSTFYGNDAVTAIVQLKVDTKEADSIAMKVAKHEAIFDVYMVTGDADIVVKAKFKNYSHVKKFLVDTLGGIPGVKETKTMMVVTAFKENGKLEDIGVPR